MKNPPPLTQHWLDSHQYTTDSILLYEKVFGEDFVSPGGREFSSRLIETLQLTPGQHVLDVGCGLGGSAFLMAEQYKAVVTGIDLSENMLELARDKLARHQLEESVRLLHKDCLTLSETNFYDAIYSRDVFLHIRNKDQLFVLLHKALKKDARLLFTDYACGPRPWHPTFEQYVASRDYHLHTADEYADIVRLAGFHSVSVDDRTEQFIELLLKDIGTIEKLDITADTKQSLARSWHSKLERARNGDHRWLIVSAQASAKRHSS